jgi:hypothetical protein
LGWGIAVFINGLTVFGLEQIFSPSWEERKVKEIMDSDEKN